MNPFLPLQGAVFLDRDGVINRARVHDGKPYPPAHLDELEVLPGVEQAMRRLRAAGLQLIVITNQPDVARGKQLRQVVEAMHAKLVSSGLPIDAFYTCYHDDAAQCPCRKPKPGMLLAACRDFSLDLKNSYLVGDRWRDIEASQRAGCQAIFLDYHYNEPPPQPPFVRLHSLAEAADFILEQRLAAWFPYENINQNRARFASQDLR